MLIGHFNKVSWARRAIAPLAAMLLCAGCGGGSSGSSGGTGGNPTPAPPTRVPGIALVAGSVAESGYRDGTGASARFDSPSGLAVDAAGTVYVADMLNHTIRKISPAGVVSTFVGAPGGIPGGDADGLGTAARLDRPTALAIDAAGNLVVADTFNRKIRKITPAGLVTTVATIPTNTGDPRSSMFFLPAGVAVDLSGNVYASNGVGTRRISPAGAVTIVEGVDTAESFGTRLFQPRAITADNSGKVYLATLDQVISRLEPSGTLTRLAGSPGETGFVDGTGAAARFQSTIASLATDSKGNLYAADAGNNAIRKITPAGVVTTVAGPGGAPTNVIGPLPGGLAYTGGIAFDRNDDLYVVSGQAIYKITLPAQ